MKQLIINADDFGIHQSVNEGIIHGHTAGIITSTSIMASGQAFTQAVEQALVHPELGVGIHLTLVGERPLTSADKIQSLVDEQGQLPGNYLDFFKRYFLGQVRLADIRRELEAQIQKVLATGLAVTHLDSHQHIHVVPGIIELVIELAKTYKIKALRIPDEPYLFTGGYPVSLGRFIGRGGLTFFARLARSKAVRSGLTVPACFFGMLAGGNMREQYLLNIINSLPDGSSEIMMHPGASNEVLNALYGWRYQWQGELKAATSHKVRQQLGRQQVRLISFRELTHG